MVKNLGDDSRGIASKHLLCNALETERLVGADVASYPRCGADACNAPWPSAFSGSGNAGAIQFTLQMSANQGILPFASSQKAAVSYATQALFDPLYGGDPSHVCDIMSKLFFAGLALGPCPCYH